VQELLEAIGIGQDRVRLAFMSAGQGQEFARVATEFTEQVRELGPNPVVAGAKKAAA
jgi:coenzyme F420-reducing hydrogenase delta subunit